MQRSGLITQASRVKTSVSTSLILPPKCAADWCVWPNIHLDLPLNRCMISVSCVNQYLKCYGVVLVVHWFDSIAQMLVCEDEASKRLVQYKTHTSACYSAQGDAVWTFIVGLSQYSSRTTTYADISIDVQCFLYQSMLVRELQHTWSIDDAMTDDATALWSSTYTFAIVWFDRHWIQTD